LLWVAMRLFSDTFQAAGFQAFQVWFTPLLNYRKIG